MPPIAPNYELYFDDPRLRMSLGGRFLVRALTWIAYLIMLAATCTALISEIPALRDLGIFLALVLIDRIVHVREADLPVSELPPSGKINVARLMRPASLAVLGRVFDRGMIAKRDFFLVTAGRLLDLDHIEEGLRRLDVEPKEFKTKLKEFLMGVSGDAAAEGGSVRDVYLKNAEELAVAAFRIAIGAGHNFIELSDLFSALPVAGSEQVQRLFGMFAIEAGDLNRALIFSSERHLMHRLPGYLGGFIFERNRGRRHRIMNRAWTARPTPMLDAYGTDYTDLAREGSSGFLVGHAAEYNRLVEILSRSLNPNAILVGDPGIGKEAIVRHLARSFAKDQVPEALFDKRLVSLEIQKLVAGAAPEELAARIKKIVDEIYMAGNVVLYIPDIHNLVRTSGPYLSAADILMPVIMSNEFPIIGGTFPKEYKSLLEPRSDFVNVFEIITVNEISPEEAETILSYEGLILEHEHRVMICFSAVKRAVALAKKYFHEQYLPASAEALLRSALVAAEKRGEKRLTADRVTAVAETKTNVPIAEAGKDESQKLLHLEEIIHERVIGQDEAVAAVAVALREYRSGLARKGGPIASFLFVGPTGVGKTELAKVLARAQFGSEKMMSRFDMTEYQSKESFTRFIGSPDGERRGALTEAIREKPYGIVLLDEFEKAHPDILNLFLQVLDDGRLTDSMNRTVDFTNTIIIATSNAHSDLVNESLAKGESMDAIAEYLKKKLTDVFRPELVNRFSRIIVFHELRPEDLPKIVMLNLEELAASAKEKGITVSFDPAAVRALAKLGYEPAFGARPLRRVIEEKVRAVLAQAILERKFAKGSKLKLVVSGDNAFSFEAYEN